MLGILLVMIACALWALDTLIRYPLINEGVSAISIVFYEHLILSVIFSVVFFKSLKTVWRARTSHYVYFFIVGGVGSALATLAFTRAFVFLNPSLVILLQKFQPVFAIALASWILKETINKYFVFWAAVSLVGAALISYEDVISLANSPKSLTKLLFHPGAAQGYVLTVFSIVGWGAATVFGKKLSLEGYSNEQIMSGRFLMGLAALLPFMGMDSQLFTHDVEVYGKISLMVFISGILAMYIFYQGLRKISARACSLAEMFFPFMAVLVNWLFLNATLTPIQLVGGGLLLLGSVIIQVKHY
ncbi:MAG: DMT family transporter [Bacteriovoracaceae bacterium]